MYKQEIRIFKHIAAIQLALFIIISGCTTYVRISPIPRIKTPDEKYPLKATVNMEEIRIREEFKKDGLWVFGIAHTWVIPTGEGLMKISLNTLDKIFIEASYMNTVSKSGKDRIDIIFMPRIIYFDISQELKTYICIKTIIKDNRNQVIYNSEISGETQTSIPIIMAFFGGFLMAQETLSESVNSAFENAFEKILNDMKNNIDFNNLIH